MALLQISEPGLSTAPHEHRLAAGIDLGTTNSLIASVVSGAASVLSDAQNRRLFPSVVRFLEDGGTQTGHAALSSQHHDAPNTIASAKRLMGRTLSDLNGLATSLPYQLIDAPGMVKIRTIAGDKSPVEIAAEILATLKNRAEASLGGPLTGVVITVPAYFDDAQRQATRDAARLAGLQVLRLLNEPTAAAIAYGLDQAIQGTYAIYDLGGGTFDISILRLSQGVFEVLSTHGDAALGGDDFDRSIVDWIIQQYPLAKLSISDRQQLLHHAKNAKECLSDTDITSIAFELSDGTNIRLQLDRATFWRISNELLNRTLKSTRQALRDAKLTNQDIDGVVLVGGATRMPHIREAVATFFGRPPLTDLDPDAVVALGAAIQANVLAGNRGDHDWLLLDVNPLSLGIETMGGLVEKIIPRNSSLPIAMAQEFTTFRDGQTAMSIHILQGERELVSDCRSLARFTLHGIPAMNAGAARIRVTLQIDTDGLLSVSARELTSGIESAITVKPSYGLDDAQIARMLTEAQNKAGDDMRMRMLRETQVDARRLLDATEAALAQDGKALLNPAELNAIRQCMHHLVDVIETEGVNQIEALRQASEALNQATQEFAARRMNHAIQHALTGKSLEHLSL